MLRKLFTVVGRYTKYGLLIRIEQLNCRLGGHFSALTVNLCRPSEIRYALNNSRQSVTVAFANCRIYPPVTNPTFFINNAWLILYAHAILYLPSCRFTVTMLVILLALLTKIRLKVAACLLI
jgi:hypothetical protein